MGFLGLFFSFKGRINRTQYWIGSMLANAASQCIVQFGAAERDDFGPASIGWSLLLLVAGLASLWVGLALTVKRLHDRGRSGWVALLYLVPVIGIAWVIISFGGTPEPDLDAAGQALLPVVVLTVVVLIYFFIDLCLLPGVAEANAHGEAPGGALIPSSGRRYKDIDLAAAGPNKLIGAEAALEAAIAERRKPQAGGRFHETAPRPQPAPMAPSIVTSAPQGFGRRGAT